MRILSSFGFLLFFICQTSFAQTTLIQVIQKIENETDYIFNYDPAALKSYNYHEAIEVENLPRTIEKLLYSTPFTAEFSDQAITIFPAAPDSFRVCGQVIDLQLGIPLELTNIYLDDYKCSIQPDSTGQFDAYFFGIKNQLVTFSYLGYHAQQYMLQDLAKKGCSTIQLQGNNDLLNSEIVVTDYLLKGVTKGESYGSLNIDYQRLTNEIAGIENDVLKTLQLLPGITSTDESASNLQIRGGTADQNLILWEGATLYDPGHLFGMVSAINPFVVDEVKVHKGVYDPSYDNRVGGVIDLSLKDDLSTHFQGGIGSTLSEVHTYFTLPMIKEKLAVTAAGRYGLHPLFRTPTLQGYTNKVFQGTRVTDEDFTDDKDETLTYYDANGKILFRPIEKLLIKGSWFTSYNYYYNATDFFNEADESETLFDEVDFNMDAQSVTASYDWSEQWHTEINWARSAYDNAFFSAVNILDDQQLFRDETFNSISENKWGITQNWQAAQHWSAKLGYQQIDNEVVFSNESREENGQAYSERFVADNIFGMPFGAVRYQNQHWQLDAGVRLTHDRDEQDWHISPRLNAQYAITKYLKINAAAGIFQQFISQLVSFQNNEIGLDNQIWILNRQEDSEVQIGRKLATGAVYQRNGWLVNAELFYQHNDNLDTRTNSLQRTFDVFEYFSGSSTARGLDLLIKKEWQFYQLWAAYSLQKVDYIFADFSDTTFPAANDQRHGFNFVNSWHWKQWKLSTVYQYRTGLPFSNPSNIETEQTEENEIDRFFTYELLNSERLPSYHRLDIGLHYKTDFQRFTLETSLSILNVWNRENVFRRDFFLNSLEEVAAGEEEFFQIDKILLGRTPQLLVRVYW